MFSIDNRSMLLMIYISLSVESNGVDHGLVG